MIVRIAVVTLLVSMGMIAGCSGGSGGSGGTGGFGGSGSNTPPASVAFSPAPPASLAANATTTLTAAIVNPPFNPGIVWSSNTILWTVSCGSTNALACGSFSQGTNPVGTDPGSMNYTAPASVPPGGTVTVTATDAFDSTKSASATITITAPPPPPPATIAWYGINPTSMQINAQGYFMAVVSNYAGAAQVQWTASCGGTSCGSFSPATTQSGTPTVYTAPAAIPPGSTVTVTATFVADPTKFVTVTFTITPPIPISISFYGAVPASLATNATTTLIVSINNDPSLNPEAQLTATCGGPACGSFSPAIVDGGEALTYTAPAAIPPGNTVTITATSITDPTKSVATNIAITGSTSSSSTLVNGTYVFQTQSASSSVTGVFVANNGTITGGEQDSASGNYPDTTGYCSPSSASSLQKITGGSYTASSNGTVTVTLQLESTAVEYLYGVLTSNGQGFAAGIVGATGNTTVDIQSSTAAPAGGYALSLSGFDPIGNPESIAGIVNIDSTNGISGAGTILDTTDGSGYMNGTESNGTQSGVSGTVSAPDPYGRVAIQLSGAPPVSLAGYMMDATHIRLAGAQSDSNGCQGQLGGTAIGQGASTGKFTSGSIAGSSFVFGLGGIDKWGTLDVAGVLTASADGTLSGTLNWNDSSISGSQSPISLTGSYTVDPTGRVTLSNLTDGSTFSYNLHLYLTGDGGGLLLSNDNADTQAGQAFLQQTAPFTGYSFIGNYGLSGTVYTNNEVGELTSSGGGASDTITGLAGYGLGYDNAALSGSFTPSANGIFQGSIEGFISTYPTTSSNFSLYVVDDTQAVAIATGFAPTVLVRLQNLQ